MRKPELIDEVNRRVAGTPGDPITKRDVQQVIEAFCDTIADELHKGEQVQIIGFGTFKTGTIHPTNPQTGERMGERQVARFSAGSGLKTAVQSVSSDPPREW